MQQQAAITTQDDNETTKEMIHARVGKNHYAMTIVTHHSDGKTIIYRRFKNNSKKAVKPFDVSRLNLDERLALGLDLLSKGWDVTQVAMFIGLPMQAFRTEETEDKKV